MQPTAMEKIEVKFSNCNFRLFMSLLYLDQNAFSKKLSDAGGVSLRLLLLLTGFFWTGLVTEIIGHIDKIANPLRVRCAIPALENNFTFDEIQSLSSDVDFLDG